MEVCVSGSGLPVSIKHGWVTVWQGVVKAFPLCGLAEIKTTAAPALSGLALTMVQPDQAECLPGILA